MRLVHISRKYSTFQCDVCAGRVSVRMEPEQQMSFNERICWNCGAPQPGFTKEAAVRARRLARLRGRLE